MRAVSTSNVPTTDANRAARITTARQRLAALLDADTYDCATLHTAARDLLTALEG